MVDYKKFFSTFNKDSVVMIETIAIKSKQKADIDKGIAKRKAWTEQEKTQLRGLIGEGKNAENAAKGTLRLYAHHIEKASAEVVKLRYNIKKEVRVVQKAIGEARKHGERPIETWFIDEKAHLESTQVLCNFALYIVQNASKFKVVAKQIDKILKEQVDAINNNDIKKYFKLSEIGGAYIHGLHTIMESTKKQMSSLKQHIKIVATAIKKAIVNRRYPDITIDGYSSNPSADGMSYELQATLMILGFSVVMGVAYGLFAGLAGCLASLGGAEITLNQIATASIGLGVYIGSLTMLVPSSLIKLGAITRNFLKEFAILRGNL